MNVGLELPVGTSPTNPNLSTTPPHHRLISFTEELLKQESVIKANIQRGNMTNKIQIDDKVEREWKIWKERNREKRKEN